MSVCRGCHGQEPGKTVAFAPGAAMGAIAGKVHENASYSLKDTGNTPAISRKTSAWMYIF